MSSREPDRSASRAIVTTPDGAPFPTVGHATTVTRRSWVLTDDDKLARRRYIASHGRSRPAHALRNDALAPKAAVEVLGRVGWNAFSLNKVASHMDLAKTALHNRYSSRADLARDVWADRLLPSLTASLERAMTAALGPPSADPNAQGSPRSDDAPGHSRAEFQEAMRTFAYPDDVTTAAIELLLASISEPELASGVRDTMDEWLRGQYSSLLSERPTDEARVRDTRLSAVLVWAFGLTVFANRPWLPDMDLTSALDRAYDALQASGDVRELPADRAAYLTETPFFTDDPRVDAVLERAFLSFGTIGYSRTRLRDLAQATGVSESFIIQRFKTKLGLIRAIVETTYAQSYEAFSAFQATVSEAHGPGIAEAVAWREYLDPSIRDRQLLGVETDRLVLFDPTMSRLAIPDELVIVERRLAAIPVAERALRLGDTHLDFAAGHGLPIVGLLVPGAHALPWNLVTDPMIASDHFLTGAG